MGRVLVIGASGYIGARLSYLLAKEGHTITALCYSHTPKDKDWLLLINNVIVGDISSEKTIDEITNNHYDTVIYLVSLDHNDSNKKPSFVNAINVLPVWNLLEMFKVKKTLKKFIYFSTIHVYGKIPDRAINESFETNPLSPYGLTHLLVEKICNMYNSTSQINCINLRLSNSYGSPFLRENNCWGLVVNDFCRTAYYKKKIILKSDGSPLRDFIHYRDIFNAIKTLININLKDRNNTYHLSSAKTLSIYKLATVIKNVFRERYKIDISIELPKGVMPYQRKGSFTIENDNLKNIGIENKTGLDEGISEIFDYLEKNAEE